MYSKRIGYHFIYVALCVDDTLLFENNMHLVEEVKQQLSSKFDMKDLEVEHFILGMEIKEIEQEKNFGYVKIIC